MSTLDFRIVDFPDASLNKTAVLVTGAQEAMLVDSGLTLSDGRRLVQEVRNSGKRLTTVFASHSDPDFHFGSEAVQDAFPEVRFLATPAVVERMRDGFQDGLRTWAGLGPELPGRLVLPEPLHGDVIEFQGHRFELRGADLRLPDRHYLWDRRQRALLGGALLFEGLHVWTADTPSAVQREGWIDLLDGMEALNPSFVAAGHRVAGSPTDLTAIRYTREYLKVFETEIEKSPDAAKAAAELFRLYPDAGQRSAAELGTKAAMGEPERG